jgi:hypothetical protein
MDAIKEAGHVEPSKKTETVAPVYQIGRTEDNRITLRIGDGYAHSTLTMNDSSVKRLIRMLEVAVEEDKRKLKLGSTRIGSVHTS